MSKELLENLLIEFDEMGYEPTILCDTEREVESFRRRLKQVLDYLKAIDSANPSEALEYMKSLFKCWKYLAKKDNSEIKEIELEKYTFKENYETIKQALQRLDRYEKILGSGRLTDRNYMNTTLPLDSCKPYLRLGQLEDIYEEKLEDE